MRYMNTMTCKYCASDRVIKYGKKNGQQCYQCKDCGHTFIGNATFPKMRTEEKVIVAALDLYYEGLSVRKVQRSMARLFKVKVSQTTVWKWIMKYSGLVKAFTDTLPADLCGYWQVDETAVKCKGKEKWFWEIIDEDTRFLVASHLSGQRSTADAVALFKEAKEKSKTRPKRIGVDGLQAYQGGFKKVFYSRYRHNRVDFVRKVRMKGEINNNQVERLHGTLKDRVKPTRGLKEMETVDTLLEGWVVYYNFLRPHQSLGGRTPAQAAGIDLDLGDGWGTLIELATIHKTKTEGVENGRSNLIELATIHKTKSEGVEA